MKPEERKGLRAEYQIRLDTHDEDTRHWKDANAIIRLLDEIDSLFQCLTAAVNKISELEEQNAVGKKIKLQSCHECFGGDDAEVLQSKEDWLEWCSKNRHVNEYEPREYPCVPYLEGDLAGYMYRSDIQTMAKALGICQHESTKERLQQLKLLCTLCPATGDQDACKKMIDLIEIWEKQL